MTCSRRNTGSDLSSSPTGRPADDHGLVRQPGVLLLMGPATYRGGAFLSAANHLGIRALRAVDHPHDLPELSGDLLGIDLTHPDQAVEQIVGAVDRHQLDAVLAVDDSATLVAARANARLGFPHNDPESALAARDKWVMRQAFARAGVLTPHFAHFPITMDPAAIAKTLDFPVVVKPLRLSGSRGVIRANDLPSFVAAWERTSHLLLHDEGLDPDTTSILVEDYLPGGEVAVEAILIDGELRVLAIFDKPDPLEGPFFEETIYVTPSRWSPETQAEIARQTARAAAAVGLRVGPVHAELRINERGVWPIELAGRSIGGMCSSVLEFGSGMSLEELILRQAVGLSLDSTERTAIAAGVMMIPIPRGGILRHVDGIDDALAVPGITGIDISARLNYPIVPLPEGASYLGFIFARGDDPATVEQAIREAHVRLKIRIDPVLGLNIRP